VLGYGFVEKRCGCKCTRLLSGLVEREEASEREVVSYE
jgi:hypothetical protein